MRNVMQLQQFGVEDLSRLKQDILLEIDKRKSDIQLEHVWKKHNDLKRRVRNWINFYVERSNLSSKTPHAFLAQRHVSNSAYKAIYSASGSPTLLHLLEVSAALDLPIMRLLFDEVRAYGVNIETTVTRN